MKPGVGSGQSAFVPLWRGRWRFRRILRRRWPCFWRSLLRIPKRGIDQSWQVCQDKFLDAIRPMTKILDTAEEACVSGSLIDPGVLSAWTQQAICFTGNANCALSTERRRSLLIKVDSKLGDLVSSGVGAVAQGGLFGRPFVKELGKCVATFTSLNKAQANIKKVFHPRVFQGAGRGRGRSTNRFTSQAPHNRG